MTISDKIETAKELFRNSKRIFVLTGAGVSAESGVPTFRGGGGAPVWRGMPFEQLSSAEMVEKDLPLVWEWFDYRRGKVSECEPNAAHRTLAKVQQSNQFEEFVIATQNIDGLHAQAGAKSVIELHGSLWQARCLNCKARKDLREIPAEMRPPICDKCSNPMRPDVILFGEAMPVDAFAEAKFFAEVCDVCLVVGTSALVYPAAELPLIAKQMGATVIEINPEETPLTAQADVSIRGKAAEILPQILDTNQMISESKKQIIVQFGFEGGGGELYGTETVSGWQFWTEGSSMDFDENDEEISRSYKSEVVTSWEDALGLLGELWMQTHLIGVHPNFKDLVWQAFEGTRDSLQRKLKRMNSIRGRWAEVCGKSDELQDSRDSKKQNEPKQTEQTIESDKHFLIYWQERNVRDHEASGYPLDVVSSRQLKRCKPGDTLWLVTINQVGELILAGRLRVGEIVDYQTAVRKLNDTSLWDGGFFALPKENEAEFLRRIQLGEIALDLRFANSESDRFVLKNGRINPQQLQTMRELTEDSAKMLARIWETEEEKDDDFTDDSDKSAEEENWAKRLEHFRQIVRDEPHNAEAHFNLGVAADENGLREDANAAYRKTIELNPDCLAAYYNLGCNYLLSRELDKSEQSFKAAIRLAPEYAPARFMLGVVYAEIGDFKKAITVTKEGFEYDQDPKAYFNVGNFYFHLQNYEKAVHWLEKSAEIDPDDDPKTFYRLGECYRHSGEKQKEFDAYRKAIEIAPDFLDALFALGTVYAHLTETAEGERVTYFETGGKLDLQDARLFYYYMGLASLALGNIDDARERQADLRKVDGSLANELQFFIDRFVPKNEEATLAVKIKPAKTAGQKRKLIKFYINDKSFEAKNIPEMYQKALEHLVDARLLNDISLPVATGEKRYILAAQPVHPTGKPFLAPVAYKGFFMEAHNNRTAAIAQLKKLVEILGCTFSEVFEFDPGMDDDPEPIEIDAEKLGKFQGCLLGGAIGDALGAAIEFDSIERIRQKFGTTGLTDYASAYGKIGTITDDTQMTLFTAEGMLRANTRYNHRGICSPPRIIYHAYLRWLETQGIKINDDEVKSYVYETQSWLRDLPELNARRAPGNSCLSALQSGKMGTIKEPINNSKGCGGVMRVAPIGLIAIDPFGLAMDAAAITHGHPNGYLSAGVLALIIKQIIGGKGLVDSINHAVYEILPQQANYEETFAACDRAIKSANDQVIQPTPEIIETLGRGWIAEEALAISIYCSLVYENDFAKAVLLAVNHSGDSDSTGAITGNILGALHGIDEIPEKWLEQLELKNAIAEIAKDLLIGFRTGNDWWNKYPGI